MVSFDIFREGEGGRGHQFRRQPISCRKPVLAAVLVFPGDDAFPHCLHWNGNGGVHHPLREPVLQQEDNSEADDNKRDFR